MESGKYEGDDRKKYKTESKGNGLLPASKLIENNPKANRKKTKEISNEFPNFNALTEEERLAFFEILNAARKNVEETKESSTSELLKDNSQDEFLEYFNGMFLQGGERKKISSEPNPTDSSTYAAEEDAREQTVENSALNLSENFDPDDLFLLDKTFKCDSASLTSLSPCQSVKEKEISPKCAEKTSLSKKNSSCTEIETWDEDQTNLNIDQPKVVNFYLKNKKLTEKKKKDSNKKIVKSSPLIESTLDDDAWSEKTYELPPKNLELEKVTDKKKKCEQSIKTDTGLSIKATPKFDSLSAEEKRIFFNVLQEAHENVLQKNSQNESGVLPFESIIKSYRMESSQNNNYNEIDSQTLRFQRDDRANIKVKVTLTSGDNQRMEKELEEERHKLKLSKGPEDFKKTQEVRKTVTDDSSSLESCEEEGDKSELTDKEEMSKLYNSKKKLMEASAKSTIQGAEAQKKLKGEDCDDDLKDGKVETKDAKPTETPSSEPKKPDEKNVEKKTLEVKEAPASEWSGEPEKPPPKKSEKKFFGFSRSKKEDKNKTYQFKNLGNEEQSPIKPKAESKLESKSVSKKEKNVTQVESFSVFEIKKKKKSDDKSENDIAQNSLKTSNENLLEDEKLQQKVSVYRNETIEGGQIFENEDTVQVKEETQTEVKPIDSTINENGHQNESDNISLDPNTLSEENQMEEPVELQVFSSKIVVSREDQNSIKTGHLLRRSTHESHLQHSNKSLAKSHEKDHEKVGAKKSFKEPSFKCGKVVLVDDGVIEKIKQLIQDLELNARSEEDSLSNDYVQLLLEYISYLSRVLCTLVNKRDTHLDEDVVQVQTSLSSPSPQLKLEKRKCKPKDKTKRAEVEPFQGPRSVSASSIQQLPREKKKILEQKKSSVTSATSEVKSDDEEGLWAPMFVKEKILPSTKIRLLQDLLKERAKFVEGSVSEFKVVRLPEKDYVPPEKPILRLNLEDEEEAFVEKGQKFNFFKALVKFCRCGRKETGDENSILENLKGEAVAVDTTEGQVKNPASATINDSTMEVLKAAERKKIIQKYWKYN